MLIDQFRTGTAAGAIHIERKQILNDHTLFTHIYDHDFASAKSSLNAGLT